VCDDVVQLVRDPGSLFGRCAFLVLMQVADSGSPQAAEEPVHDSHR